MGRRNNKRPAKAAGSGLVVAGVALLLAIVLSVLFSSDGDGEDAARSVSGGNGGAAAGEQEEWPLSAAQEEALRRAGANPRPTSRAEWDHLISTLHMNFGPQVAPLAHTLARRAREAGVYTHPLQRPSVAFVPGLDARPWHDGAWIRTGSVACAL